MNVPEDESCVYAGSVHYLSRAGRSSEPREFGVNDSTSRSADGRVPMVANADVRLTGDPLPAVVAMVRATRTEGFSESVSVSNVG